MSSDTFGSGQKPGATSQQQQLGDNALHDYDPHAPTTLLLQQQQTVASVVDYYQNPNAIYNQIQNHYGGGDHPNNDLATQQYLQNLRDPTDPNSNMLESGKKKIRQKSIGFRIFLGQR